MSTVTSIDMSRFCQTFFEECGEHLAEIEQILLTLDPVEPDGEELNALFRAAHTIKGSSGIFGFEDMTAVTHLLESLLDRIRNREMPLSPAMIDLFLTARDAIAMQLAGHRDGAMVDLQMVEETCCALRRLTAEDDTTPGNAPPSPPATDGCGSEHRHFVISFAPDANLFLRGARLEYLFEELAELGTLEVEASLADASTLEELNPEECCSRWQLHLTGACREGDIREVMEFVADEEQLQIRQVAANTDAGGHEPEFITGPAGPAAQPVDEPQILGRRAYDRNEMAQGAFGRRGGEAEASIRVGVPKVDQLINQVGELVITQAMLSQVAGQLDPVQFESLHRGLLQLERNTRDLQQSVMSIRLLPIGMVFSRFPRMVRELAGKLGKQVELKLLGEATELDKGLVEKIADPLTHLVRNALDHALETPEARIAAGKSPTGTVTLQASQVGGRIVIDVMDDGAGLNREKIVAKAAERGIPTAESMSDEEVWQLIFAPGFSTAETVTDLSGRGVGMDVVLKNVQTLGGRVAIQSEPGRGTRVTISLPLTLAILDGLSVCVGTDRFIIPLTAIIESLQPGTEQLKTVNGKELLQVRGHYLPILPLYRLLNLETRVTRPAEGILVLVDVEGDRAAILVDALLDEQQVVVKSLETNFRKVDGASGATILGDGRVALILDVHKLLNTRKSQTQLFEED